MGGAIGNDVHGKNHHLAGSFGHHVLSFELLRGDGERRACRPGDDDGWFEATLGGLGLTGLITHAELQLRRVPGSSLEVENIRFSGLADFFALSQDSSESHEYSVAWIDCLARGRAPMGISPVPTMPRSHRRTSSHAPAAVVDAADTTDITGQPAHSAPPFNTLYYWRQPAQRRRHVSHLLPFFYPLDGISQWNRMYGPAGFVQYQCVLPPHASGWSSRPAAGNRPQWPGFVPGGAQAVRHAVPLGMLSFPRPGTTLALDFPNTGEALWALLRRLDQIVDAAGGAQYPAKDARMTAASFQQAYPRWQDFSRFIDPRFSSGFWRRVTGKHAERPHRRRHVRDCRSRCPALCARGARLFLVGRRADRLAAIADDLRVRGARAHTYSMDINDLAAHAELLAQAWQALGRVDVVLVAHGTLPDQAACEASVETCMTEFATNGTSTLALLEPVANRLADAGSGALAVITSVVTAPPEQLRLRRRQGCGQHLP